MKKLMILEIYLFLSILTFTYASNCGSQVEIGNDCNVMVKPLDSNSNKCTSSCACNMFLYNPSYAKIIDNNKMTWDSIRASFWLDTNALLDVSGEWIVDINCSALDVNRSISGQIYVVDRDTNHLLHDINADVNLMPNKVWLNGIRTLTDYNMATLPDFIWGFSPRTLTDYNQSLMFSYLNDINASGGGGISASDVWAYASRNLTDYNQSLMFNYLEDINNLGGGTCPSASDIWAYSPKALTDYNQSLIFTYLNDLNQTCTGEGGGGLTASDVWNYSPRDLTGNTSEISLLYSNLEKENAYRYCAIDDVECLKAQEGRNPILDQNATSYVKQQESPNFFGFEISENNLFILIVLILIVCVLGFFVLRKD